MQRYKKILKPPNKITSKYLEIKSKPTFLLRKWVNCYIIAIKLKPMSHNDFDFIRKVQDGLELAEERMLEEKIKKGKY